MLRYITLFLATLTLVSASKLSEVMYNPPGSDYDLEWIEIYTENSTELNTTQSIRINNHTYSFTPTTPYYILAREYEDGNDEDNESFVTFYNAVPGEEVPFTLPNKETQIILNNYTYTYAPSQGANGDGASLAFNGSTFIPSKTIGGTPGKPNDYDNATLLITSLSKTYYLTHYDSFFTITNRANPRNISFTYSIYDLNEEHHLLKEETLEFFIHTRKTKGTGSYTFFQPGNYSLCAQSEDAISCHNITVIDQKTIPCDLTLDMELSQTILNNKEQLTYKFKTNNTTFPFTVEYGVQDIYGKWSRKPRNTSTLTTKSFTPKFEGLEKTYLINATLHPTCNDTNPKNNHVERAFGVRGTPINNALKIETVSYNTGNKNRGGNRTQCMLNAKVVATKADAKKVLHLRAKDKEVIGEAKADLLNKGKHQLRFTIPLKRCPRNDLHVTLSGLGLSKTITIPINKSILKKTSQKNKTKEKETLLFEILHAPQQALQNEPFDIRIKITNPTNTFHNITTISKIAYRNTTQQLNLHIAEHSSIEFDLTFKAQGKEAKIIIDHYIDEKKTPHKQRITIPLKQAATQPKEKKKIIIKDKPPLAKTALVGAVLSLFAFFGVRKSI